MSTCRILLFILLIICSTYKQALTDKEDDCKSVKSLKAKKEMKHIELPTNDKYDPRSYCVSWKISAQDSEIIEVEIPAIVLSLNDACRDASLKLSDDESEYKVDFNKLSDGSRFSTEESDLMIYYKPNLCRRKNLRIFYRSVSGSDGPDESGLDDDDDESKGVRTASIVGAVIGALLAVALIICAIFLIRKCTRQNRASGLAHRDVSMGLNIWSKDRGYVQTTDEVPSSSRETQHTVEAHNMVPSQKPAPTARYPRAQQGTDAHIYNNTGLSTAPAASPPVPPPYPGHEYGNSQILFTSSSLSNPAQSTYEPPPPYATVFENK